MTIALVTLRPQVVARARPKAAPPRQVLQSGGGLERRQVKLDIEEDFFVNYGFLPSATQALMHRRRPRTALTPARRKQMDAVLAFLHLQATI